MLADVLRWEPHAERWVRWTPARSVDDALAGVGVWRNDDSGRVLTEVEDVIRFTVANDRRDGGDAYRRQRDRLRAESVRHYRAVIELMAPRLAVGSDGFDSEPHLLGTPGGVVDLRSGERRHAVQSDMVRMSTSVEPAERHAECPMWEEFMDETTGGDADLHRFLWLWWGYSLWGDPAEQKFLICIGPGGNGKGVMLGVVSHLLGGYARAAPMETFVRRSVQAHPTELAMLTGARLVTAQEVESGGAWAQARLQSITGGDTISARFMRQDFFEFQPRFSLTFAMNDLPSLRTTGNAIRRRMLVAPFLHQPAVPRPTLKDDLIAAEGPAILRWMIEGCVAWQRSGLGEPSAGMSEAADEYIAEQDIFGQWLSENTVLAGNARQGATTLYEDWVRWSERRNERPGTQTMFGRRLGSVDGVERKRTPAGIVWHGIGLLGHGSSAEDREPPPPEPTQMEM